MIEAKKLTKYYGSHMAVSGLSFRAEKGKVLGFLGPNGAGKSTTMNMLTGYISATSGDVSVCGIDMFEEPEEAKKHIGYLPEIPPLYVDMTVDEYLHFVAELKSIARSEVKAMLADIKGRTGLNDVAGRLIKHLSKGYRQRVGLAGALIGYPEVLILDEPTVGLDPKQIIEIRDLIRGLAEDHAIILSSHILTEISEVCDEIMIINHGRLVAVGTPEELTNRVEKNTVIHIEADAEAEAIEGILAGIAGIASYKSESASEDGVCAYVIEEQPGRDVRKEIFFAFAAAQLPLLKIVRPGKTLEEVFLKMTETDRKAAGQTAKPRKKKAAAVMKLAEDDAVAASTEEAVGTEAAAGGQDSEPETAETGKGGDEE